MPAICFQTRCIPLHPIRSSFAPLGSGNPHSPADARVPYPRLLVPLLALAAMTAPDARAQSRPRAREAGVVVGILPPGPLNAITDVAGVRVGQVTRHEGDSIHTGVTAILAHEGNLFRERVPAAIRV